MLRGMGTLGTCTDLNAVPCDPLALEFTYVLVADRSLTTALPGRARQSLPHKKRHRNTK